MGGDPSAHARSVRVAGSEKRAATVTEIPKLSDLMAEAVSDHGRATADLFRRLDQEEQVDLTAETIQCLGQLFQTGARFFLFWDNIATLMAADGDGPLTFPAPKKCAEGEKHDFTLPMPGISTANVQSGLRRRGETTDAIDANAITVALGNDQVVITVDCSGAWRGLYEGTLTVVDANGTTAVRAYNVYIDPA